MTDAVEENRPIRLAAFDLDGTLLWGQTVCEAIAKGIGRIQRMRELEQLTSEQVEEITAAREEIAEWYSQFSFDDLRKHLPTIRVAPGVVESFTLLRDRGFKIAIVSLTWEFAVEWFADKFGADFSVGTGLSSSGLVTPFWPKDKAHWLARLADNLGVNMRNVAAVGDSSGDIPMLLSAGHRYWVGQRIPVGIDQKIIHEPTGDIYLVARQIVNALGS